jgi:alcohol dehydrogenase
MSNQAMNNPLSNEFLFSTVSDVLVGPGTAGQLGEMALSLGMERALVVTDPGIIKFGLLDSGVDSLKAHNIELSLYSDVVADPPESVVMDAVAAAQAFG